MAPAFHFPSQDCPAGWMPIWKVKDAHAFLWPADGILPCIAVGRIQGFKLGGVEWGTWKSYSKCLTVNKAQEISDKNRSQVGIRTSKDSWWTLTLYLLNCDEPPLSKGL